MILQLIADWTKHYTAEEAEVELVNFKFKGEGWYLSRCGEAMLVAESHSHLMHQNELVKRYAFSYWSSNPMDTFNWVVNAPVRSDEREGETIKDTLKSSLEMLEKLTFSGGEVSSADVNVFIETTRKKFFP